MTPITSLDLFLYLTPLLTLITKGFALSCYQCKNYPTFYVSPVLNTLDCTNSSNYAEVTCDASARYCLKAKGYLTGSGFTTIPQPNTLDGVQRGCLSSSAAEFFTGGTGCQTGTRTITINYTAVQTGFMTSLMPTYTFAGVYCLCQGDRCNTALPDYGSSFSLIIVVIALTGIVI